MCYNLDYIGQVAGQLLWKTRPALYNAPHKNSNLYLIYSFLITDASI